MKQDNGVFFVIGIALFCLGYIGWYYTESTDTLGKYVSAISPDYRYDSIAELQDNY